jgi:superoxide dismutase
VELDITTKHMVKKINYSDPLPREALDEILNRAFASADNLEQQINKTNMTDNGTKITINTQTNTDTSNTNTTDENIPTWKKLYKSFVAMMITFMFVYAGWIILIWLYDTLGMNRVMPTLIGLTLWVVVYDHMYGTASKAPRIK